MNGGVAFVGLTDAEANAARHARLGCGADRRHLVGPGLRLLVAIRRGDARILLPERTRGAPSRSLSGPDVQDVDGVAANAGANLGETPSGTRRLEAAGPDGDRVPVGATAG
jgi:hypothetical protein